MCGMKLSDNEILELNELCNALADGALTDTQRSRLSHWLANSDDARRFYIRSMGLSASLFEYAGEMQIDQPSRIVRPTVWSWRRLAPLAAAAGVAVAALFLFQKKNEVAAGEVAANEFVARLTDSKDCQWIGGAPGDSLHRGQRIELAGGSAEITFDSGAQVVLTGPASFDVGSAWDGVLRRGTLRARVPAQAIGFRVSNPDVEVVDLGTEFSMVADGKNATEVFVLEGSIEAASGGDREPIVLRERESRRFAKGRVSAVADSEKKFARLTKAHAFAHAGAPVHFVHWSFDEAGGGIARAEVSGIAGASFDARIEGGASASDFSGAHVDGRWARALRFDGEFYAHAPLPQIEHAARTVAFWVKVPEDAPLASSSIVAWGARDKTKRKSGEPFVQIGWNRNPTQGTPGALRADFGHGLAIGATPLRDGRWHHVAVVFVPGRRGEAFTQAKLYVDGRLEEATARPDKKQKHHAPAAQLASADAGDAAKDWLWIGRRAGAVNSKKTNDRFCGDLDELFLADRALAPREIVHLMNTNTLAQPKTLAAE